MADEGVTVFLNKNNFFYLLINFPKISRQKIFPKNMKLILNQLFIIQNMNRKCIKKKF